MVNLYVVYGNGGWSVKFHLDDPASVLIEQKIEAIRVAQNIATRHEGATILLCEKDGQPPKAIEPKKHRQKMIFAGRYGRPLR
jgi:hypothetical protein